MPDRRTHRGPHPRDEALFGAEMIPRLRAALADYCLLLGKGYADGSALKLVGDHFGLIQRQRMAVMRCACSDAQAAQRAARRVEVARAAGGEVDIDGYNLLITLEAALSGGVLLAGRDGCLRDLASIHGTYRRVAETLPAIQLAGAYLSELGPARVRWLLDSPVSNSGRLKTLLRQTAEEHGWPWTVELAQSPDGVLARSQALVATTDSAVLDRCGRWMPLAGAIVRQRIPSAWIIDLSAG